MNPASYPVPPPRLLPDWPLPAYAHIPGKTPHPISDPRGHSFGAGRPVVDVLDPEHWQACPSYLYGLDLFNHGYYWEAHETWEALWHACKRTGPLADFLKALIKLAAAGVKAGEGKLVGVKTHATRAVDLWRRLAEAVPEGKHVVLGLRIRDLIGLADAVAQTGWPANSPWLLPVLP